MKSRGRKVVFALMIMTLVTFAAACGNNENDRSNADTSEMTHMEIKELEQKDGVYQKSLRLNELLPKIFTQLHDI